MAQKDIKDIKNLTLAELKKQDKALDKQREFNVTIGGQQYKLSHDIVFRNSKKNKLLDDMVKFFGEAVKNVDILELSTPYVALLILKHFTTLDVSDDVNEAIALLTVLIDLDGALGQILAELPEDQLTEVYELLTKTVTSMTENLEGTKEDEIEDVMNKVDNQEVKEMIKNDLRV